MVEYKAKPKAVMTVYCMSIAFKLLYVTALQHGGSHIREADYQLLQKYLENFLDVIRKLEKGHIGRLIYIGRLVPIE